MIIYNQTGFIIMLYIKEFSIFDDANIPSRNLYLDLLETYDDMYENDTFPHNTDNIIEEYFIDNGENESTSYYVNENTPWGQSKLINLCFSSQTNGIKLNGYYNITDGDDRYEQEYDEIVDDCIAAITRLNEILTEVQEHMQY